MLSNTTPTGDASDTTAGTFGVGDPDAERIRMAGDFPLQLLRFFRDLTGAQRLAVLIELGALPADWLEPLNQSAERRALDRMLGEHPVVRGVHPLLGVSIGIRRLVMELRIASSCNSSESADKSLRDGRQQSYDPRRQQGVSVYREEQRVFSVGDRIQFTAPDNELKIANRELGKVEQISNGRMNLLMDDGRSIEIDPVRNPHLDHGYAVTSHSSQGQTAERVLVHVDTEVGAKDLLNNRMAYVSVSRGAHDAQIFTNDREKLPIALGHEVSQQSAHAPQVGVEKGVTPQQDLGEKMKPQSVPEQEISHGFSIG